MYSVLNYTVRTCSLDSPVPQTTVSIVHRLPSLPTKLSLSRVTYSNWDTRVHRFNKRTKMKRFSM
ncbi:hypothetical protein EXN66_Car019487 [Channa argus]|uniref:Uncharacterized protein n=1 Tax=Channa argus TaxID=215402 RepID=A0A6G1QN62_CHAAH|nr:hypothetical protein EXN66_Car019487 [Channa argus]